MGHNLYHFIASKLRGVSLIPSCALLTPGRECRGLTHTVGVKTQLTTMGLAGVVWVDVLPVLLFKRWIMSTLLHLQQEGCHMLCGAGGSGRPAAH